MNGLKQCKTLLINPPCASTLKTTTYSTWLESQAHPDSTCPRELDGKQIPNPGFKGLQPNPAVWYQTWKCTSPSPTHNLQPVEKKVTRQLAFGEFLTLERSIVDKCQALIL